LRSAVEERFGIDFRARGNETRHAAGQANFGQIQKTLHRLFGHGIALRGRQRVPLLGHGAPKSALFFP
jgi:hypothetical protein